MAFCKSNFLKAGICLVGEPSLFDSFVQGLHWCLIARLKAVSNQYRLELCGVLVAVTKPTQISGCCKFLSANNKSDSGCVGEPRSVWSAGCVVASSVACDLLSFASDAVT